MKRKIILISLITLLTFLSSLGVIYHKNTVKLSFICGENADGCSYVKYGSKNEEVKFGYKDILQCSIETLYKPLKDKKGDSEAVIDTYELNLYIASQQEPMKIRSKNSKELAMICAKIPDEIPFKIVKRQSIK